MLLPWSKTLCVIDYIHWVSLTDVPCILCVPICVKICLNGWSQEVFSDHPWVQDSFLLSSLDISLLRKMYECFIKKFQTSGIPHRMKKKKATAVLLARKPRYAKNHNLSWTCQRTEVTTRQHEFHRGPPCDGRCDAWTVSSTPEAVPCQLQHKQGRKIS